MHRTILSSHPDPRVRRVAAKAGPARAQMVVTIARMIWSGLIRTAPEGFVRITLSINAFGIDLPGLTVGGHWK
ncbi:MAG TPA: hypothetical protein VD978_26395 [Azospirillum sp.]|nr:hypothetical protein [Azospirillum sp.]